MRQKYDGNITNDTLYGTLPEGYRPTQQTRAANYTQVNGANCISINIDGKVYKVGTGTDWVNLTTSYLV